MSSRWLAVTLCTLILGGCSYAVRENADALVCELPNHPFDLNQLPSADQSSEIQEVKTPPDSPPIRLAVSQLPADQEKPKPEKEKRLRDILDRFKYPAELPGSETPPIKLPDSKAPEAERRKAIEQLYPPLPPLGADPQPEPGPEGRPLTLADLQRLAQANSPLLRQPAADVQAAWGAVLQAGAYPNPTLGYQSDQVGSGDTAGMQGLFIDQTFKTAGKLEVAQASATMAWQNAKLAFRKAQSDLASQVRRDYFAVLLAQENVKISKALARFTDEIFRLQVDQLTYSGEPAGYEPMQLRVQAMQARAGLVQARNRYTAAWIQLAATLGLPAMRPTQLAGHIDMPIPKYHYKKSLAYVLSRHTDVLTAQNTIQKARYDLRLAQITPIPDVSLHLAVEKDFTTPPFVVTHSVQLGVPVPIFDRNRGHIIQAQAVLLRANEEPHRVSDALTHSLAGAFEAYDNSRVLLDYYRQRIIADQVEAYRGVYRRHLEEPERVSFGDVVTAQQTLISIINSYVTALGQAWTAVVNFADLMQTNDLFQIGLEPLETQPVEPVPDLENLCPVPCSHPCTPMPDPKLKGGRGEWPPTSPEEKK